MSASSFWPTETQEKSEGSASCFLVRYFDAIKSLNFVSNAKKIFFLIREFIKFGCVKICKKHESSNVL